MTQVFAHNCQIISRQFAGYGHYEILIEMQTNIGTNEIYNYTTTSVNLIDDLKDHDNDVVNSAKESLMDSAMAEYNIEKSNDFTYIY